MATKRKSSRGRAASAMHALMALLGCGLAGCGGGSSSAACTADGDCNGGEVCVEGACGACADDGQCASYGASSICVSGFCTSGCRDGGCACTAGEDGCACRDGASPCRAGLACVGGMCAACADGSESCACRASGDACDDGLACRAGTCEACAPGDAGCACGGDGRCADGLVCTSDMRCAAPDTCAVLFDVGLCAQGHACEIVAGAPRCLDVCDTGYQEDGSGGCVPCEAEGCEPAITCDDCEAMHRVCADDGAHCGGCDAGYRLDDASGECVDERLCGDSLCGADEMPEVAPDGSCTCVPHACEVGQAVAPDGSCVACTLTCDGVGESGVISPRTTASGECLCATAPGYFIASGGDGRAARCDEDGDGWVRQTALSTRDSGDAAYRENARCDFLEAARVELENEYGQRLSIYSCGDGLFAGASDAVCSTRGGVAPIELVEPDRNDSPSELAAAMNAPAYAIGEEGRAFEAAELNGLTRACVSEDGDFDGDGTADVAQVQPTGATARSNAERLAVFAHFIELDSASFSPSLIGAGALVIAERSRCDESAFPLRYEDGDGTWWRECHRRRDPAFDGSAPAPGTDFLQWSCGGSMSGTCDVPLPATAPGGDPMEAPLHGLCELGAGAAWGSEWRGMHHASQFRCALVGASAEPYAVESAAVHDPGDPAGTGTVTFERCYANDPGEPLPFTCTVSPAPGAAEVGWIAERYMPGATRGCIDEAAEPTGSDTWGDALCPAPDTIEPYGDELDFGALRCGCEAPTEYALDADGDGWGVGATVRCASPGAGYAPVGEGPGQVRLADCDDENPDQHPETLDEPDAMGLDMNCDGTDGDVSAMAFVSQEPAAVDAPGAGTRTTPYRTLEYAIEHADGRALAVQVGTYEEGSTLVLRDRMSLYGGYLPGWAARSADPSATVVTVRSIGSHETQLCTDCPPETVHVGVALDVSAVRSATRVEYITFRAARPASSYARPASFYGIRGYGTAGLTLDHVNVDAAEGDVGQDGARPRSPVRGADGLPGTDSCAGGSSGLPPPVVLYGGGPGGEGSRGGSSSDPYPAGGAAGTRGADGHDTAHATGGLGGDGGDGGPSGTYAGGAGTAGRAAGNEGGSATGDGGDGLGPDAGPRFAGGWWIPLHGWPGATGGAGGGGGGGGGGAYFYRNGAGGGGGGQGGAGGAGGGAGGGGGGSFAVFFVEARDTTLRSCKLHAGDGGDGGDGGAGAEGAEGGTGGPGGPTSCGGLPGGPGGNGGHGGRGGSGSGGAGGDSFALVAEGSSIDASGVVYAHGSGGLGGAAGASTSPRSPNGAQADTWPASPAPSP